MDARAHFWKPARRNACAVRRAPYSVSATLTTLCHLSPKPTLVQLLREDTTT